MASSIMVGAKNVYLTNRVKCDDARVPTIIDCEPTWLQATTYLIVLSRGK